MHGTENTVSTNRQADPRKLNHLLRGELDWITMKAIEKDRTRRYDTAGDFAADIGRYRGHRPVEAGPPSAWYRGRKFARRHRMALTMSALVVLSAAAAGGGMWTWSAGRLDRARRDVEQSRAETARRATEARHRAYAADIRQAHQLAQSGQGPKARELLYKYRPAPGEEDIREFAWYYLMRLCHGERLSLRGHQGAVYHAGFSPDGRTLVSCGQDGTVRLWDVATGRPICTLPAPGRPDEVNWAEFSPDGRALVSAGDDGKVRLWNVTTGDILATIPAHEGEAYARFTPDGRRVISAGRKDGLVKLWDIATRGPLKAIKASDGHIENVVVLPDGRTLATTGSDGAVRLWAVADLSVVRGFLVQDAGPVYGLAFSADGTRIATGDGSGFLRLWDPTNGQPQRAFSGGQHSRDIQAVTFLAGDRMIVSGGALRGTEDLGRHHGTVTRLVARPRRQDLGHLALPRRANPRDGQQRRDDQAMGRGAAAAGPPAAAADGPRTRVYVVRVQSGRADHHRRASRRAAVVASTAGSWPGFRGAGPGNPGLRLEHGEVPFPPRRWVGSSGLTGLR